MKHDCGDHLKDTEGVNATIPQYGLTIASFTLNLAARFSQRPIKVKDFEHDLTFLEHVPCTYIWKSSLGTYTKDLTLA